MSARALGLALTIAAAFAASGCSSPAPVADEGRQPAAGLAQRVAGRWTLVGDAPLSALVTGFDVTPQGERLTGRIYLSGRVLPAAGRLTADGFTLAPEESAGPSIAALLRADGSIDATVTALGRPAIHSRFERAESR